MMNANEVKLGVRIVEPRKSLPFGLHLQLLWMMDKRTEPGWSDIRQNRNCHTFYWVQEGRGRFVTGEGEEWQARAGMLFYLHPGLQLHMRTDHEHPLRIAMVLVSAYQPQPMQEESGVLTLRGAGALPLPFVTHTEGDAASFYQGLFADMLEQWVPGQAESELAVKARLFELLDRLHRTGSVSPKEESESERLFKRIRSELTRSYAQPVPLREWAVRFGISESYLRALFGRYEGRSPKSYVAALRNEHARRMLLYTDRSMKEIADSCGYGDEFHFSKSFKKLNGMPPRAFRNGEGGSPESL